MVVNSEDSKWKVCRHGRVYRDVMEACAQCCSAPVVTKLPALARDLHFVTIQLFLVPVLPSRE